MKYRIGVRDEAANGIVFWYDQETYDAASHVWHLLREYGRDGVTATVQQVSRDSGEWETVLGDSLLENQGR
jgi:hypothetical protein